MPRSFSRRRYVVDWKLQGSLTAHGLFYGALVLAAIVGGVFLPLVWDLGAGPQARFEEQAIVMLYMHERLWPLALVCAAIVVVSAIKVSHRIAGPLVRFKRNLRLIGEGKLPTPLRTRPHDFLQDEVACLNDAVAGLSARLDAIRTAEAAVRKGVAEAAAAAGSRSNAALAALVAASGDLERAVAAITQVDPGDDRQPEAATDTAMVLATAGDARS